MSDSRCAFCSGTGTATYYGHDGRTSSYACDCADDPRDGELAALRAQLADARAALESIARWGTADGLIARDALRALDAADESQKESFR